MEPESRRPWHRLHLWQIQFVRDCLVGLALFGILYICSLLRGIIIPMLIGLFIADIFEPVVRHSLKFRWLTRARMVISSTVLAVLTIGCVIGITVPPLVSQTRELIREVPAYCDKLVHFSEKPFIPAMIRQQLAAVRDALSPKRQETIAAKPSDSSSGSSSSALEIPAISPPPNSEEITPATIVVQHLGDKDQTNTTDSVRVFAHNGLTVFNVVVSSLRQIFDIVIFLFLVPFFAVLFSLNFPNVRNYLHSIPPETHRNRVAGVVRRMERSVGGFFRGRLLVCLILATAYAIGLTICAVPYGLLIGLVTGMLCLIPYLHFVGLPLTWLLLTIHLNEPGGVDSFYTNVLGDGSLEIIWWRVLILPLGVWMFAQLLDDYVLSPLIQRQATDLHPAIVILSILGGGMIGGFYGIVISVPLVACSKILFADVFMPAVHEWLKGKRSDPLPLDG